MAPILFMDQQAHLQPTWTSSDGRQQQQTRTGGGGGGVSGGGGMGAYAPPQQQWTGAGGGGQMHIMEDMGFPASSSAAHHPYPMSSRSTVPRGGGGGGGGGLGLQPAGPPLMGGGGSRELLGEGTFMGRGYSIKRCQGFVRCDMDIDAEVVGWVIGKNGSTIKDMKHKTGCNMWVDQRALKLTITGPDLSSVEHAAKSVDAYVAAAPIKAGAVEAAVTRTLDCPPHLLDMLGDRTTIARIVKETHAQVVVNKKIGRIIVRGDHRSVELACQSVQATIQAALHGGLGLRVNTPDSGNGGGYFSGSAGAVGTPVGLLSPVEGGGLSGMMHMLPPQGGGGGSDFGALDTWQAQQLQLQMQPSGHPVRRHHGGRASDSDESEIEIETVSLGSIGARTPVSSVAGSPRLAVQQASSLTASPALSAAASTPGGDWSLFSSGFGLGVTALAESSSCTSTPSLTAKATPKVHFPEEMKALGTSAVVLGSAESADGEERKDASVAAAAAGATAGVVGGAPAPPPSPASTSGENARKQVRQALVNASALETLEGDDDEGSGGDIEDKVACLGKRLQAMGLGKYCSKFAENEVDLEALGLMSEGDLADIGIPKGPRLKILNAVGRGGGGSGAQQQQSETA